MTVALKSTASSDVCADDDEPRDEQDDPLFERALAHKTKDLRAEVTRKEWEAYVYRRALGATLTTSDLIAIMFYAVDRTSDPDEMVATIKSRLAARATTPRIVYRPDSDAERLQRENTELRRQLTNTQRELSIALRDRADLIAMIQATEDRE